MKDHDIRSQIKEHLLSSGRYGYRNWLIFIVGINIGRRAGDLLTLRIGDVWDGRQVRREAYAIEEKTGKQSSIPLNTTVREALEEYILSLPCRDLHTPLFPSQKTHEKVNPLRIRAGERVRVSRAHNDTGCLTTDSYCRILRDVRRDLDLTFQLSTHSMRKTWAYDIYQNFKDQLVGGEFRAIDAIQLEFKHADIRQSLQYIGITDEIREALYECPH